jgi:hypothetical protein
MTQPATTPAPSFEQFASLYDAKRRLDAELRGIKAQIAALEEPLMEQLTAQGLRSCHLTTGETVYLHRQVWAGVKSDGDKATAEEKRRAVEALEQLGMTDMVTLNYQTLSAWCREHDQLPPELDGVIELEEKYSLRCRRG